MTDLFLSQTENAFNSIIGLSHGSTIPKQISKPQHKNLIRHYYVWLFYIGTRKRNQLCLLLAWAFELLCTSFKWIIAQSARGLEIQGKQCGQDLISTMGLPGAYQGPTRTTMGLPGLRAQFCNAMLHKGYYSIFIILFKHSVIQFNGPPKSEVR